jgi:hypothetical protein
MTQNVTRWINFISGINGVSPGGNGLWNGPVNQRYHRLKFRTKCINYTGGVGAVIIALTGTGISATGTLTVSNGRPTAIAIVAGGSGWTVGDTFTIADATGAGFVGTVATVTGGPPGALATATVTVAGTATNADPTQVISSIQQLVNGVPVRDIEPDQILRNTFAMGLFPALGELPLYYTSPDRNILVRNDVTSWDLFGQSTFAIKFNIRSDAFLAEVTGTQEFDFLRNVTMEGGKETVFLEPVAQHQYGFPIVAGRNDITTLPFDFPINRLWLLGSNPGNLYQLEIYQDGNKFFEATADQMDEMYADYGFTFGRPDWLNTSRAASATLQAAYAEPRYYDMAFIADEDERYAKRLKVANSLIVRVYSDVAQQLTVMSETMPGNYV